MTVRRVVLWLALVLPSLASAQTVAPGYGELDFTPPAPGSYQLPSLGPAADAALLSSDGEPVRLHQLFGGRYVLLSFFYTRCSDLNGCPLAAYVLQKTLRRLSRQPQAYGDLNVVSLSFDPANDTPRSLASYGRWFTAEHPNWSFATAASETEITSLLDAYGQNRIVERYPDGRPREVYAHTLRVFLIDPQRRIRNVYSTGFLHPDVVINDLQTLRLSATESATEPSAGSPSLSAISSVASSTPPVPATLGLPPPAAPADPGRVALGRKLFFDRRLSINNTLSCAMCHIPTQGFANNEMATAVGLEGRTVKRNAPTLLNVGYLQRLFHDGRESTLAQQAWQPLLAANEMGNVSIGAVLDKLRSLPDYAGLFRDAFGRGPDMLTLGQALADYQRTLIAGGSAFDRWYYRGERRALAQDAQRGFDLFRGRAGCSGCHLIGERHALFTDQAFHNTGIGWYASMKPEPESRRVRLAPGVYAEVDSALIETAAETPPNDLGRYEVTLDPGDRWRYRTPSLRNVALTAPYMHDGSLSTLAEVVDYYDRGGHANPGLDPRLRALGLGERDKRDLVAFLRALTADAAVLRDLTRDVAVDDHDRDDPHWTRRPQSRRGGIE